TNRVAGLEVYVKGRGKVSRFQSFEVSKNEHLSILSFDPQFRSSVSILSFDPQFRSSVSILSFDPQSRSSISICSNSSSMMRLILAVSMCRWRSLPNVFIQGLLP